MYFPLFINFNRVGFEFRVFNSILKFRKFILFLLLASKK